MSDMKRGLSLLIVMIAMELQSFTNNTISQDIVVYICVTGKVYHSRLNCRGLKNATHQIKAISLSEAKKFRRPCKVCY